MESNSEHSSPDSTCSTASYTLRSRLPITYNKTALSHLNGRPRSGPSISCPSLSQCQMMMSQDLRHQSHLHKFWQILLSHRMNDWYAAQGPELPQQPGALASPLRRHPACWTDSSPRNTAGVTNAPQMKVNPYQQEDPLTSLARHQPGEARKQSPCFKSGGSSLRNFCRVKTDWWTFFYSDKHWNFITQCISMHYMTSEKTLNFCIDSKDIDPLPLTPERL